MDGSAHHDDLAAFLRDGRTALATGPVALILAEDAVEVASTLRHHRDAGFRSIVLLGSAELDLPTGPGVTRVAHDMARPGALEAAVNGVLGAMPAGEWLYYGYNAEYLFFPFCEHRSIGEMLDFHAGERRDAMLAFVVDLYAGNLEAHPSAVALSDAHLDRTGYYALARPGAERQFDFHGGLRWRFEEHVPEGRRRIDRVALVRARPGLRFRSDYTFSEPELNTFACPWHHNLTAAVCSFRTAKALKRNPGSRDAIGTFLWHNSAPFEWHSRQLLELGLMEPGQWF